MKRLIGTHFGLMAALMLVMAPVQSFAKDEEADKTQKTETADKSDKSAKKIEEQEKGHGCHR